MTKDWNDAAQRGTLYHPNAPHETAGVLRMHRAGISGPHIMQILRLRASQVMARLNQAMDMEHDAHRRGLPIHDALIEKGTK